MGTQGNPHSNLRSKPSLSQYVSVRQRLDDLGYNSYLSNDSVLLVDKLLTDLIQYKELCMGRKRNAPISGSSAAEQLHDNESHGHSSQQRLVNYERTSNAQIEALKLENSKLSEQISDFKFVLDQNTCVIQKLKKDNDSKSVLILQLQNGKAKSDSQSKVSRPNIEKDGDLPSANLSKIQSLYNKISSASENPAIIDWVKAAETKISNLERELENTSKALDVSQQTCELYQKQLLEHESQRSRLEHRNNATQNYAQLKCRIEQKERENRELQTQLSEAVRKQHEAMSRAIMLAGDRPRNRDCPKHAGVEKKMVGLESERNVLKQMLTTTQKERDELMKEVHRLHSQESALMNEIRTLVSDESSSQGPKGKNVRFQTNNKNAKAVDSGVESLIGSAQSSGQEDGGGRNRENWLKRLTEQRQSYYDNVHQLLNYMKNRQAIPMEHRPNSQQSSIGQSSVSRRETPDSQANFSQVTPNPSSILQQSVPQGANNLPQQTRNSNQSAYSYQPTPPLLNFQQPNQPPSSFGGQSYMPQQATPAQYQQNIGEIPAQQQPTFAQPNLQWNAQSQRELGNISQQKIPGFCVCGGLSAAAQQPFLQSQAQPGFPQTYQQDPNYPQSYQSNGQQPSMYSQQANLPPGQRAQMFASQTNAQSSGFGTFDPNDPNQRISRPTTTNVQDRKTQTGSETDEVYIPTTEDLEKLPDQMQSWAQAVMEEKKVLKEKNTELRLEMDELAENSQKADSKVNEITDKLQKAEDIIGKLQTQLESSNAQVQAAEQGLQAERNNLQQLRLDIDEADGNASSLTQKFVEKSTELEASKLKCNQLEQNVSALDDQLSSLKNQLEALQSQNQRPNPAVQKLMAEVEGRNNRILQLENQLSAKQDQINQRGNDVEAANRKLNDMEEELQSERDRVQNLQQDMSNIQNKLKATERDLSQEKNRLQQLQADIANADSNAASLSKKMMEKSAQLDSSNRRCQELEQEVSRLGDQIGGLQGQLRSVQVQKSQGDTERRQIMDELDSCKARIAQLERQSSTKQDTITMLQSNIQTYENKINNLEKENDEKKSQVELNRRTNDRLASEVDKAKIDNASLRQENERLVASLTQTRSDLDRERQEIEDLRREIQSYVCHVRQVESILARKDEEKDALLKQFQALANESSNFDAEKESMERSIRNQQQEVTTLQTELATVRRRLGELEQLYSQQKTAGVQAEMQADDLLRRLGGLERDLRDARGDKVRMEQQLAASNDLQHRLEKQLEKLRVEAAQADSTTHQMESETTRLQDDLRVLEQRLSKERENVRNLESLVSILRQERSQQETQMRTMSQDMTRLHHREILLQEELANSKAELCSTEGKVTDLSRENQRLKQEVLQEKFEREKSRQEHKRMGNLSSRTPPLIASYNVSPAPLGALHNLSSGTISTNMFAGPSGASANASPRRRVTVAARFANNETQTARFANNETQT